MNAQQTNPETPPRNEGTKEEERGEALVFPPGTRAFALVGNEMEPQYHAGEILFIAPDEDGKYVAA